MGTQYHFTRINPMGLTYSVSRENDTRTRVVYNKKIVIVEAAIRRGEDACY